MSLKRGRGRPERSVRGDGADHEAEDGAGRDRGQDGVAPVIVADPVIAARRVVKAIVAVVADVDGPARAIAVIVADIVARLVALIGVRAIGVAVGYRHRAARIVVVSRAVDDHRPVAVIIIMTMVPAVIAPVAAPVIAVIFPVVAPTATAVIVMIIVMPVPTAAVPAAPVIPVGVRHRREDEARRRSGGHEAGEGLEKGHGNTGLSGSTLPGAGTQAGLSAQTPVS